MQNNPLFSIIIPTKNPNKNLFFECLDSIYLQTYKCYELIIVANNCSKESLLEIKALVNGRKDVILIETNEIGVSRARSLGIKSANGKYCLFIDDNDLISSTLLETLSKCINSTNSDFVMFHNALEENKLSYISSSNFESIGKEDLTNICFNRINPSGIEIRSVWGKAFSLEIIKKNNFRFCDELFNGEDTCFVLNFVSRCNNAVIVEDYVGYYYRQRNGSVSVKYNEDIINQFDIYCDEYKNALKLNNANIYSLYYVLMNQIIYNIFISFLFNIESKLTKKEIKKYIKLIFTKETYKSALKNIKLKDLSLKKQIVVILLRMRLYNLLISLLNRRYKR